MCFFSIGIPEKDTHVYMGFVMNNSQIPGISLKSFSSFKLEQRTGCPPWWVKNSGCY